MIDLHTHSSYSDGSDSPARIVELAKQAGCVAIALTDHDCVDGLDEAFAAGNDANIEVVPGIELSCHTTARNIHLLGYFIDHRDKQIIARLETQQQLRLERNLQLCDRLVELGMPVTYDEVKNLAGGKVIGRPHFAAALLKHGYVSSINEAFIRFLADGGPAFVERKELPAAIAIQWITEAGGVAVWAHPQWRGKGEVRPLENTLAELCKAGLGGIEARYSRYNGTERRELIRLAKRYDLVATGGSDYHGTYKPDLAIGVGVGDLNVPYKVLDELRNKLSVR